jgi:hypothetical protein
MKNYSVTFKSLRAGTVYTVHIGGGTGAEVPLKGGAQPFVTQEDDNEDMFTPIRTQSGYLRIVDDGFAEDGVTPFDWKDLIPSTDVSRPVRFTDANGNVMWQGFMQSQNFSGTLYGNPQEREFPLQCSLSVLGSVYMHVSHKEIGNFAYLLNEILYGIPFIWIEQIIIQGNTDAIQWLLTRIDWSLFVDVEGNGNIISRYTLLQCLKDMCSFWGWTVRTFRNRLYFVCADDSEEQNFLSLTRDQLNTLANGEEAGVTGGDFPAVTLSGDIFASFGQYEFQLQGPSKVEVEVNAGSADNGIINPLDKELEKEMSAATWDEGYTINSAHYTKDVLTLDRSDLVASAVSGSAAFNILSHRGEDARYGYQNVGDVVSIKKDFDGTVFMSMETVYEHCFHDGFFRILADTYVDGSKYEDTYQGRAYAGNTSMTMRLGIGKTRESAKWWDGRAWQNSIQIFYATIGNKKPEIFTRYFHGSGASQYDDSSIINVGSLSGRIFIDFLGVDPNRVGNTRIERFDLKGFRMEFRKNDTVGKRQVTNSGWYELTEIDASSDYVYSAQNDSRTQQTFNVDCVYGGDNKMNFSPSILINTDNSYMTTVSYNGTEERPEQHLSDRIADYWNISKRMLDLELQSNIAEVGVINPQKKVALDDGFLGYPVAISHEWRDDITQLKILQL